MLAERYVFDDPNSSLIKQRQLAEAIAHSAAATFGILTYPSDDFAQVLKMLREQSAIAPEIAELFHAIRRIGNDAVHKGTEHDALRSLQITRKVAIWFHRTVARPANFKPGPFVPPPNPDDVTKELRAELESLRNQASLHEVEAKTAKVAAEEEVKKSAAAEAAAVRAYADLEAALTLAEESEKKLDEQRKEFQAALHQKLEQVENTPDLAASNIASSQSASSALTLTESETRILIDMQLRAAGWEADSQILTFASGARPQKNRNLAIAEWPTNEGPADYALFAGLDCVGIVEAKRKSKTVKASALSQPRRRSITRSVHCGARRNRSTSS